MAGRKNDGVMSAAFIGRNNGTAQSVRPVAIREAGDGKRFAVEMGAHQQAGNGAQ
jgi:hypothetical protein